MPLILRLMISGLVSELGTAHMMLHVGDFGYDLGDNDGKVLYLRIPAVHSIP